MGVCIIIESHKTKKTKTKTTSGYFWREKEEEKSTRVEPLRQGSRAQRLSAEEAVKRCTLSLYPQARLPPHTVQLEPCYNPEGKKKTHPAKSKKKKVQWNVVYIYITHIYTKIRESAIFLDYFFQNKEEDKQLSLPLSLCLIDAIALLDCQKMKWICCSCSIVL